MNDRLQVIRMGDQTKRRPAAPQWEDKASIDAEAAAAAAAEVTSAMARLRLQEERGRQGQRAAAGGARQGKPANSDWTDTIDFDVDAEAEAAAEAARADAWAYLKRVGNEGKGPSAHPGMLDVGPDAAPGLVRPAAATSDEQRAVGAARPPDEVSSFLERVHVSANGEVDIDVQQAGGAHKHMHISRRGTVDIDA